MEKISTGRILVNSWISINDISLLSRHGKGANYTKQAQKTEINIY